jgi:hypothetical protein
VKVTALYEVSYDQERELDVTTPLAGSYADYSKVVEDAIRASYPSIFRIRLLEYKIGSTA